MIVTRFREDPVKFADIMTRNRIKCKCGYTLQIPADVEKTVCSWCGNYVFRDKKVEFEYRMNEEMRRNNGK